MAFPGRIPELLENNKTFMTTYKAPPDIVTVTNMGKKSGAGILVLTCLDPRVVPEVFLGPGLGAGVIRNAAGRATQEVINSLVLLRGLAGTNNVMVIHHTDCGAEIITNEQVAQEAKERTPDAAAEVDGVQYGCFSHAEYEETIKKDVMMLRNAKALAGMNIFGFSFDIKTGSVTPVEV